MKIWWVRHAKTRRDDIIGWSDVPAFLDDPEAINRLHAFLPKNLPILSSDLQRAKSTADAIEGRRSRMPDARNLREFNFGDWEGQSFGAIAKQDPKTTRAYWETPGDVAPPNGESWNQAASRINRAVDQLIATHESGIICVSHFGVILTQLERAAPMPAASALAFKIDHLSVTCIDYLGPDTASIERVNHKA